MSATLYTLDLSRPHQVYKNAAGKRVPGVTTILGVLAKPALLGWYANEERAGIIRHLREWDGDEIDLEKVLATLPERPFAETKRDKAADLGTVTHARCEAFLKGMELDESNLDPALVEKSQNGAIRFMDWWRDQGLTLVESEHQMVSERLQVGGTADIIAKRRDGGLVLVDLKTSKASKYWPYPETFAQVSAYASMYHETGTGSIDEVHVVRIGKEEGDAGQTYTLTLAERDAALEMFDAACRIYNAQKALSR